MAIPEALRRKMVRAPGASATAVRASYGLPPVKKMDWAKVKEVARHMAAGYSRSAACGKAKLSLATLTDWETNFPAVYEEIGQAKLQRLANLEQRLLTEGAKMPQIVSAIFALKNANPDEWKENPDKGPHVAGLQQNITIITGVPEAPPTQPVIEHEPAQQIEFSPLSDGNEVVDAPHTSERQSD